MLEKTYDPHGVEAEIYESWETSGAFRAGAGAKPGAESFTIVIPPPNVTGSLHMGHALNNTLQDVLCRFQRMNGKDVLWQPGMDHAGIATQMVVERQMMERQEPGRRDIGREAFVEKVWSWKEESGGAITGQLRRLGASCDWSRERFTMDEGLSEAVLKVFVTLYREGLIYRDKRLVNWDPVFNTAISDIEVEQKEINGHLWHFDYPVEGTDQVITVATTRPETMLGDTAVAVNPEDERYTDLIGRHAVLPLVGRRIPIVADDYADPEAGSGAVKITPAHDFNDFEVGQRHNLPKINIFDSHAAVSLKGNEAFLDGVEQTSELSALIDRLEGQDRFAARKVIVGMMEEAGRLREIEPHRHMVPHGDRSHAVIEPYLTDQWYVDAKTLARPAIASVKEGRTAFVPKNWEKTYFEWMENIQPWCISRQLWWGHQIPVWYGPDGHYFVELSEADAEAAALAHYGEKVELKRDEDVLDTWFSSALWPFSTLGWPEETPELRRYYQTDVLVTAFDIIFFWVARMMMSGLHFMKEEPFHTVYIHALVRDEKGDKMSKSKGNVIDPLELIDEFGADALRFTFVAMAAQGRDIKLAKSRVAGYRNFATKIWNAARFCEMNGCRRDKAFDPQSVKLEVNRWILTEAGRTATDVSKAIGTFRFNDAGSASYRFVWNTFCDWYLELIKPVLNGPDGEEKDEVRATAAYVLDDIMKILHPMMPFLTEHLWREFAPEGGRAAFLMHSAWPEPVLVDDAAATELNWLVDLVSEIRSIRNEMNIAPSKEMSLNVKGASEAESASLKKFAAPIKRLGRISSIGETANFDKDSAQFIVSGTEYGLPLSGVVDFDAEVARLNREIKKLDGEIERLDKKLGNQGFLAKAPENVVLAEREKRAGYAGSREKLEKARARFIPE